MLATVPTVVRGDFEWDSDKAQQNEAKHGVTFDEAVTVFHDPNACDEPDAVHPDRLRTIGFSAAARLLLVVTAERGDRIRIISARKATAAEQAAYEEG